MARHGLARPGEAWLGGARHGEAVARLKRAVGELEHVLGREQEAEHE